MLPRKHPSLISAHQRKNHRQRILESEAIMMSQPLDEDTMLIESARRRASSSGVITGARSTLTPQISPRNCLIVLAIFATIQLLPPSLIGPQRSSVVCQGFEDLNSNNQKQAALGSQQQSASTFQPSASSNRQQQVTGSQRTFQRPVLSTRFSPSSAGSSQQPLSAQASFSASVFSEPPAALPSSGSTLGQQPQPAAGVSNIEQLMKNALARTAQINSAAAAAEPRQDSAPQVDTSVATRSVADKSATADSSASASEASGDVQPATGTDDADKQTTAAQTTTAANAHETVYSDQRFANLFARRNTAKKRIQPTEQVKAKPTLPSFIKSPPDPKQFAATQAAASETGRPATASGPNSFAQKQQQQQGRLNNQQKKAAITSNSAASAQNKRANALNGKPASNPTPAPGGSRSAALNAKANGAATSKPSASPQSNNPFSRSQGSSSDPANVIAMARKRLLANNALETAKLKQQQNNKPTTS